MSRIGLLVLGVAPPLLFGQQAPACTSPEHRAFDFWIGVWDVYVGGRRAAENTIDSVYSGCALREQYRAANGFAGSSLSMYDAGRKVWHQTWVDGGGTLLLIEGGLHGGAMVMEGETRNAPGAVRRNRLTWTALARDSVRQRWEVWSDSAGAWRPVFDGLY
ncbi:MAG: hypothetical protein ACREMV_15640, partial [Gemmatimonadales bacterium]